MCLTYNPLSQILRQQQGYIYDFQQLQLGKTVSLFCWIFREKRLPAICNQYCSNTSILYELKVQFYKVQ